MDESPSEIFVLSVASALAGGLFALFMGINGRPNELAGPPAGKRPFTRLLFVAVAVIVSLAAGILADAFKPTHTLGAGLLLYIVAFMALGSFKHAAVYYSGVAAAGAATGFLLPSLFLIWPYTTSGPENAPAGVAYCFVVMLAGAGLLPWAIRQAIGKWGFRNAMLATGLLAVVPIAAAAFLPFDRVPDPDPGMAANAGLADPRLWFTLLGVFGCAGYEVTVNRWSRPFFQDELNLSARWTISLVAAFWISVVASRLAAATMFYGYWGYAWLTMVAAILTLMFFGNLTGAGGGLAPRSTFLVLGVVSGPILPTLIGQAIVISHRAEQNTDTPFVIAALTASSIAGAYFFDVVTAQLIDRHERRTAMWIVFFGVLSTFLVGALLLVLG